MSVPEYQPEQLPDIRDVAGHNVSSRYAMVLTGAAFDAAQASGVVGVAPDIAAMTDIARASEFIAPDEDLPSLVLFGRLASRRRRWISKWDDRWPRSPADPVEGRFFSAANLAEDMPPSGTREHILQHARTIGATAITEITIPDWQPGASYIEKFAAGLLLAHISFGLDPDRTDANRVERFIRESSNERDGLRRLKRLRTSELREPFVIYRRGGPGTPANVLPGGKPPDALEPVL